MKYIGAHVSALGGVSKTPANAAAIGANAFALFTKNQRQWQAKPLESAEIKAFRATMQKHGFRAEQVLPHDSYLINLGNPNQAKWEKCLHAFVEEIERCALLGLDRLNFHPGSHLKQISERACLDRIANSMNLALAATEGVSLVIENTAGQGTNLGYRFEHLAHLINRIDDQDRVGACLDTAHAFAAGYELRTAEAVRTTLDQFDSVVGLEWLRGMHLNDSKAALGSRVDRHQSLGAGEIGWVCFETLMADPRLDGIPLILETIDESLWPQEIETLRGFAEA